MNKENIHIQLLKVDDEIIAIRAILIEQVVYDNLIVKNQTEQEKPFVGKLNYQNEEIPVFDIRLKPDSEQNKVISEKPIVIIRTFCKENNITKTLALVVDELLELAQFKSVSVINLPQVGTGLLKNKDFFYGMAYCCNKFILLLDIEKLIRKYL